MNIEPTLTAKVTKSADTSTSSSTSTKDSSTTFKGELESVKSQDAKTAQTTKANEDTQNALDTQTVQKNEVQEMTQATAQQLAKDKLATEKNEADKKLENAKNSNPLDELNSQIATLNELKNGTNTNMQSVNLKIDNKTSDKISDKGDYCQIIKMDNNDITFFLNLVDNQQMTAQSSQLSNNSNNTNLINNNFTEIRTEATQSTVQISKTLMDALNDSSKTGKPVRIDFDSDVAVIMKVDKNGTLSANFIPGDAAVESYLRNNIAGLRQSFDNQGLQYNELSYSRQQKQSQDQNQKQSKNKENEHE